MTSVTINRLGSPPPLPALPTTTAREFVGAGKAGKAGNRMTRVLAVLQEEPERQWRAREIAELLGDVTLITTYRQLARWTEKGALQPHVWVL